MMRSHSTDSINFFLAGVSGLLLTGAFPNVGWQWLAWFALLPLWMALSTASVRKGFLLGWIFGMVHFLTLIYWIAYTMRVYGYLPWWVSIPVLVLFAAFLALFFGLFGWITCLLSRKSLTGLWISPAVWVVLEYGRSILFSGFPWELIGHSQYELLPVIQIADIFGAYGVSFVILSTNTALFTAYLYITQKKYQTRSITKPMFLGATAVALLLLVATVAYGLWRTQNISETAGRVDTARVAVVQGNIPQAIKWDPDFQVSTLKKYFQLSTQALRSNPDLIVWPETAAPFYFHHDVRLTEAVINGVRHLEAAFLIGSPTVIQKKTANVYYNSAYLIKPQGIVAGVYHKAHLVPFGEYVPLKRWLPFLGKIVAHVGDFSRGKPGDTIEWNSSKLGILICYELIFPYLARTATQNGANVLVNMTNDAWYGRTGAPYQHFSMAVFRAIENRRCLIRSANTGISGFIEPTGRIQSTSALFEPAVKIHTIPLLHQFSLYTRYGDWFAIICLLVTGSAVVRQLVSLRRHQKNKHPGL